VNFELANDCALLVHTAFDYSADGVAKDKTAIDTLLDLGRRGAKAQGARLSPGDLGDFADALALSQHVDARKVVRLLGWWPGHAGFLDEAHGYYRAWKAHQD